ncbi:uncharacterized protein LOC133516103 isoform X2 [Cydia pomonella]|uniref:uncharacterized protein LOC133516103 isoform X2 n=1 Tax=Cydia pomonella TaxID=82600 RepID=UPI002ADDD9A2|nr:uncharacterized protein LOC133516103 isoform X2 [Cydia pomonella]
MKFLVLFAVLTCVAAAPLYVAEDVHITLPSKTTITQSSVAINHGGDVVASVPAVHSVPVVPVHPIHILHAEPKKTTITKSNLSINHDIQDMSNNLKKVPSAQPPPSKTFNMFTWRPQGINNTNFQNYTNHFS